MRISYVDPVTGQRAALATWVSASTEIESAAAVELDAFRRSDVYQLADAQGMNPEAWIKAFRALSEARAFTGEYPEGDGMSGSGPYLEHYTALTGHSRRSPRSEVAADVLERLGPVLQSAIRSGDVVDVLASGSWLSAVEDGGRLKFRLFGRKPGIKAAAAIRCTLWPATWSHAARLEVDLRPGLVSLGPERVQEAGGLERCVAWCWLEARKERGGT